MTRTYVVTGAASGIGAATKALLEEQGHCVIGVDLHNADVTGDLASPSGRAAIIESIKNAAGDSLDGVITCAGLRAAAPDTISVNYFGTVELLEGLRLLLAKSPAPRVAVVSSLSSVSPQDPAIVDAALARNEPLARAAVEASIPDHTGRPRVYSSSKTAVSRWVRQNAIKAEWGGAGILLNAVAPGTVKTAMTTDVTASPEATASWLANLPNPQDRIGEASEIAAVLVWLASAENSMILGQTVFADLGTETLLRGDYIW
ncbi:SDR family oxidoreductase [Arthrobacter sp. AZCC_0090]|uniref:SDR family oxidoreductase n=1 Tax=Arthrobacter sp. AZCC_0090 TaxID=2735881 RepID=UPI00161212FA|nr:SDR family oxidoreductase [Arthrobacter sp. AZCC_0090]MBB6406343.1 NAD(P)-dependent dehydrogenase (short-subunit alcohol dehydrogenase family) [Arthrobacter sp. AZCC_0090]